MKNLKQKNQLVIIYGIIAAIIFPVILYLGMSFKLLSFDVSCWDIEDRENFVIISIGWFIVIWAFCYLEYNVQDRRYFTNEEDIS